MAGPLASVHFLMDRGQLHKASLWLALITTFKSLHCPRHRTERAAGKQASACASSRVLPGFWSCLHQGLMGNRPVCLSASRLDVSWRSQPWSPSPQLRTWHPQFMAELIVTSLRTMLPLRTAHFTFNTDRHWRRQLLRCVSAVPKYSTNSGRY